MALKWGAVVVAAVSVTIFVTANSVVAVLDTGGVPLPINLATVATAVVSIVLAVMAEMYAKLHGQISSLADYLAARLNEVDDHTGDRNAGFVEGYLLSQGQEASVVPIGQKAARRTADD